MPKRPEGGDLPFPFNFLMVDLYFENSAEWNLVTNSITWQAKLYLDCFYQQEQITKHPKVYLPNKFLTSSCQEIQFWQAGGQQRLWEREPLACEQRIWVCRASAVWGKGGFTIVPRPHLARIAWCGFRSAFCRAHPPGQWGGVRTKGPTSLAHHAQEFGHFHRLQHEEQAGGHFEPDAVCGELGSISFLSWNYACEKVKILVSNSCFQHYFGSS